MRRAMSRFSLLVILNVVVLGVLGFYRASDAQPPRDFPAPGVVNSASQRLDMIEQLKETNRLLAEQNALLKSGQMRVVVIENK